MSNRLKLARKAAHLNQTELARLSGVRQNIISALEHEHIKKPSHEVVTRIARALGVGAEELFPVPHKTAANDEGAAA